MTIELALLAQSAFWPVASLLFFFALFLGILAWVILAGRSGRWKRDARMPLDDDKPTEPKP